MRKPVDLWNLSQTELRHALKWHHLICVFYYFCMTVNMLFIVWSWISAPFKQCCINNFVFKMLAASTAAWSTYFPCANPLAWKLLSQTALIGSFRDEWINYSLWEETNTVWRGDEWNWELGLKNPLREIEGINDCTTARGPQWLTLIHGTMAR